MEVVNDVALDNGPEVKAPRTVKVQVYAINPNIMNALKTYLGTRPFNEVVGLINSLSSSPLLDAEQQVNE